MARSNSLGKSIVLIILIIVLCLGGLLWFDFLGVLRVKNLFSPVFSLIGLKTQTSATATSTRPLSIDLDQDRLDRQREALEIFREELELREAEAAATDEQNRIFADEIASREKNLEEREKEFNNLVKIYDDKNANIDQTAAYLEGMRPEAAVAILVAMDDQLVIDVLRQVEQRAAAAGTQSLGAYWLSLMPSDRAAAINRKMSNRPVSIE